MNSKETIEAMLKNKTDEEIEVLYAKTYINLLKRNAEYIAKIVEIKNMDIPAKEKFMLSAEVNQ